MGGGFMVSCLASGLQFTLFVLSLRGLLEEQECFFNNY